MTNRTIWLDRVGDADLPLNVRLVESEVEFLRHAVESESLMVRGCSLCEWAETFFSGRGIAVQETRSPIHALEALVPTLSTEQATELLEQLKDKRAIVLEPRLNPYTLMEVLYPLDLWGDRPSRRHAAKWLLWLYKERPSVALQKVLELIATEWQNATIEPERSLYSATNYETARSFLHDWLLINTKPRLVDLGEFPEEVPDELYQDARRQWRINIIETDGGFFDELIHRLIPSRLRRMAAEEMADFLLNQTDHITAERLRTLAPYLDSRRQRELSTYVSPAQPGVLPESVPDILFWFENQYLPYRVWQDNRGNDKDSIVAQEAAREFAMWYLKQYPQIRSGGPLTKHFSFRQSLTPHSDVSLVTLVIVLDGLHAQDALYLRQMLAEKAPRLQLLETKWVFAPLPTVTEFAKPTLFTGLAPIDSTNSGIRAEILPERINPTKRLSKAEPGQLFFWRVGTPDDIYHSKNSHDSLHAEIESALDKIAKLVADIVREVPPELRLRVVLTTDHGRLLAKAPRTITVPPHMVSHGRAAWGERNHDFDESGLVIDGDMAFLHAQRYGLPAEVGEVAIIIGPQMFMTNDNKRGSEYYPHGGASPEEVIVPWWLFERDWQLPEVNITASGSGVAGSNGRLIVHATNPIDITICISRIQLRWANGDVQSYELELDVNPRARNKGELEIHPWPSSKEAEVLTMNASIRLPDGKRFEIPVPMELTTEEMYRRDNILEDLE